MTKVLKAPFPYFGGKSRIASEVWARIGDVDNAIEPFMGSLAWILARPHAPKVETVNDLNCYVANFWRAVSRDADAVVFAADWPVNEIDMHARHRWIVRSKEAAEFREKMRSEPDHFDAKIAGWWCWGACCWIGSGWCDMERSESLQIVRLISHDGRGGDGIHNENLGGSAEWRQLPDLSNRSAMTSGTPLKDAALALKVPRLSTAIGQGSNGRPQLADAFSRGRGVNGNDQAETCRDRREWLLDWFGRLQDRLRTVRVCCGDWKRVCESDSVTTRLGTSGIFLDPPYPTHNDEGDESRNGTIYATDGDRDELDNLRDEVLAYCKARGGDPRMRIAVCGYDTDGYAALEAEGWQSVAWKANGGYANRSGENANAGRERIWFSPHCIDVEMESRPLLRAMET